MRTKVAVSRISLDVSVEDALQKILASIGGLDSLIHEGDKVLLKPNACIPADYKTGITTHPAIIANLTRWIKELGAIPIVGDGPFIGYSSKEALELSGISKAAAAEGAKVVEFLPTENYEIRTKFGRKLRVTRYWKETDKIITLPTMKTHMLTLVSLGIKNLMGLVHCDDKRIVGHYVNPFELFLLDLLRTFKPTLNIIDGIIGHEGNGPTGGNPIVSNLLIASTNTTSADAVGSYLMGINPTSVKHIKLANQQGEGPLAFHELDLYTDPNIPVHKLVTNFKLPTTFQYRLSRKFSPLTSKFFAFVARKSVKGQLRINTKYCISCGKCAEMCPHDAIIQLDDDTYEIVQERCQQCFCCHEICPNPIKPFSYHHSFLFLEKILASPPEPLIQDPVHWFREPSEDKALGQCVRVPSNFQADFSTDNNTEPVEIN